MTNGAKIGYVYIQQSHYNELSTAIKNAADSSILFFQDSQEIYVGNQPIANYGEKQITDIYVGVKNDGTAGSQWIETGYGAGNISTHNSISYRTTSNAWLSVHLTHADDSESQFYGQVALQGGVNGFFPRYTNVAGRIVTPSLASTGVLTVPEIGFDEWGVCDALNATSVNLANKFVTVNTVQNITKRKSFILDDSTGGGLSSSTASEMLNISSIKNGTSFSFIPEATWQNNMPVTDTTKNNDTFINVRFIGLRSTSLQFSSLSSTPFTAGTSSRSSYRVLYINGENGNITGYNAVNNPGSPAATWFINSGNGHFYTEGWIDCVSTGTFGGKVSAPEFFVSSDANLKRNKVRLTNEDDINIYEFEWNQEDGKQYGFIAQEVEKEYPQLVSVSGKDEYKQVNYNSALSLMISKLYKRIEDLETEVKTLKTMVK